jgi:hypothetical protein
MSNQLITLGLVSISGTSTPGTPYQDPCHLMALCKRRLACHDGIDAASVGSLPLGQEDNPGLHGAVALGLGHCIVRRQFLCRGFRGLRADDLATAHATHAPRTGRLHSFAGQLAGLLHPSGELSFVELVVLMDVEVARVLALGLAGGGQDAATCLGIGAVR